MSGINSVVDLLSYLSPCLLFQLLGIFWFTSPHFVFLFLNAKVEAFSLSVVSQRRKKNILAFLDLRLANCTNKDVKNEFGFTYS